jgi:hypothetical protein
MFCLIQPQMLTQTKNDKNRNVKIQIDKNCLFKLSVICFCSQIRYFCERDPFFAREFHFCCWEEAFKSSSLETTEEEEKLSWKKSRCSASQTKDCKHQLMDGCKQHLSFLIFFPPSLLFFVLANICSGMGY